LIREVYRTVCLDPLETCWEELLSDRGIMIGDALDVFLAGFEQISDRKADRRQTPLKVIG
jgi:hypothetical protein